MGGLGEWDKARWQACAAEKSGSWLQARPSIIFNTQLSNGEVQYGIGRRLGCQLCAGGPCPFCLGFMDKEGAHCECCMSGGDKTVNHNVVRDTTYLQSKRAHAAPQLEVTGISALMGLHTRGDSSSRPADVLLARAQDIPTSMGHGAGRVALDIGIVCPQAASHLSVAAAEVLGAAESYVRSKCARADVARRCSDAGVVFQPLIFESFGGVSTEAVQVLKGLNKAVAVNSESSEEDVAQRFWQRVGVDILRGNYRAFARRVEGWGSGAHALDAYQGVELLGPAAV